MLQQLNSSVSR